MKLPPPSIHETGVRGVQVYHLPICADPLRGSLTVAEFASGLPFQPQRFFLTYGVPADQTRGDHAHRHCAQFLLCTHGECHLHVDDGDHQSELHLDRPTVAVLVPPLIWSRVERHSPDSALLVLASFPYEEDDYIRDYAEFLTLTRSQPT